MYKKIAIVSLLALGLASRALAVGEFDPTTATASFTSAASTSSVLVGSLVTLGAGIAVYLKVRGFFQKGK